MITSRYRNRTGRRVVLMTLTALTLTAGIAATSGLRSAPSTIDGELPIATRPADEGTGDAGTDGEAEGEAVSDGQLLGRLTAAYVAPNELLLDEVELLEGDNGDGAYALRDVVGPARTLPVAGDVVVTRVDCSSGGCREGVAGDYDRLTLDVADQPASNVFRITVRRGEVVEIDEVYLA